MNKNMSSADRKLRAFAAAPVLAAVGVVAGPAGWLATVLYTLAAGMLMTIVRTRIWPRTWCRTRCFGLRRAVGPSAASRR